MNKNDEGSLLGLDGGYEVALNIQDKEEPSLERTVCRKCEI
jgi:hypothetical protein